jgi:ethanolamine utilization cobalamin adenosyltransferase
MKTERIVKLMDETKSVLAGVLRTYGQIPMTEERAETVADIVELLDLIKDIKEEMREDLERKIEALHGAIEVLG